MIRLTKEQTKRIADAYRQAAIDTYKYIDKYDKSGFQEKGEDVTTFAYIERHKSPTIRSAERKHFARAGNLGMCKAIADRLRRRHDKHMAKEILQEINNKRFDRFWEPDRSIRNSVLIRADHMILIADLLESGEAIEIMNSPKRRPTSSSV